MRCIETSGSYDTALAAVRIFGSMRGVGKLTIKPCLHATNNLDDAIQPGKVATGNIQPDTVSLGEHKGCWIHADLEPINLARLHQRRLLQRIAIPRTHDAICDVQLDAAGKVCAGRVDVARYLPDCHQSARQNWLNKHKIRESWSHGRLLHVSNDP